MSYHDIDEAEDGCDALEKISHKKCSVIFLDWHMPVMGGLDCLREIKADKEASDIPVIMITSESEKPKIMEAIMMGAANYLVKPFQIDALKEKLSDVLNKQKFQKRME
ncbi:response regulator [Fibrobacterota bacterium]